MEKQLFGFFEPVHAENFRRIHWSGIWFLILSFMVQGLLQRGYCDTMEPPSFAVERVESTQGPQVPQVGDGLQLRVMGIVLPGISDPKAELKLDIPSNVHLQEDGWELEFSPHLDFVAVPLKPGNLTLPSLVLKNSEGKEVGRTQPLSIQIKSAIREDDPQPKQPVDLEPPVGVQFPLWIFISLGVLFVLFIVAISYWMFRWFQKRKRINQLLLVAQLKEDEVAIRDLILLDELQMLKKGQFKTHYFRVSEILKAYVGERYRLDALESTTQEMISLLELRRDTGDSLIRTLEAFFNKLDRVKFTDHIPISDESNGLILEAKEFIVKTRRQPMVLQTSGVQTRAT